jgi:hypothetical protein
MTFIRHLWRTVQQALRRPPRPLGALHGVLVLGSPPPRAR